MRILICGLGVTLPIAVLTIQINQAKVQSQVQEITETEYFNHLQQRAGKLRAARSK